MNTPSPTRRPGTRHAGFSMVELLVALVILAGGILGFAALQVVGLHLSNSTGYRTQASLLLNGLVERMRANFNSAVIAAGAYNNPTITCTTVPSPYCEDHYSGSGTTAAASCTPAQLAAFDLNVWFCGNRYGSGSARAGGVTSVLPGATATIAIGTAGTGTVSLQWTEQAQGATGIVNDKVQTVTLAVTL